MAEPLDSAVFLEDVSDIAQTQYFTEFTDQTGELLQQVTNKFFKPYAEEITGTGKTLQVKVRKADGVRFSNSPLSDFPSPDTFAPTTMQVRFNKTTSSSNDFSTIQCSVQTDDIDIQEAGKGSIINFVDELYDNVMPEYEFKVAVHRHLGRNGVVAYVNATPKQNNATYFSGATATGTNTTGLRVQMDTGSIAAIRAGDRVDFINPSSGAVRAGQIEVTDVNPADLSFGCRFVTTGVVPARTSTGDLSTVADNDYIVFSGEYNVGMYSFGAYHSAATASESFIGGVDRTAVNYRWLNMTDPRRGASSARITKSMFNDLAISMGYIDNKHDGGVILVDPKVHQTLRDDIGEDAFIAIDTDEKTKRRFMNFGSEGLNYQHSQFGVVKLIADPLANPNRATFLVPETWRSLFYGWKGLRRMPGANGGWYRVQSATPASGDSKIWKCDWYANQMDFCFQPWRNGQISAITAT